MQTGGGVITEGGRVGGERRVYIGDRYGEGRDVQGVEPVMASEVEG